MPRHVSEVAVRWSDVDRLGHVNNVVLLRYLQEARVDMLFRDAARRGTAGLASGVLIRRHDVRYAAPIRIAADADGRPRPIRVELWVSRVTAATFEIAYEVRDGDGTACVTAASLIVPYDLAGDHARRITPDEREILGGFAEEPLDDAGRPPAPWAGHDPGYTTGCAVRFDDLDSYGHVNNTMVAEYLQQSRIDLNGRLNALREPNMRQVVARLMIDYLRPIPFRTEPVTIDLVVTRIGTSSFDLAYEMRDGSDIFARAASTMVAYDVAAAESRPLTGDERDALEQLRVPVGTAA